MILTLGDNNNLSLYLNQKTKKPHGISVGEEWITIWKYP